MAGITKNSSLTATPVTGVCVDRSLTFAAVAFAQLLGVGIVPIAVTATVSTSDQRAASLAGWATGIAIITMRANDEIRHIISPPRHVAEHRDSERPLLQGGLP